jgi:hypothetical protein
MELWENNVALTKITSRGNVVHQRIQRHQQFRLPRHHCAMALSRMLRAQQPVQSLLRVQSGALRTFSAAAAPEAGGEPVKIDVTTDGIAIVRFDAPGEKMNTLSAKLMASFDGVLTRLESDPAIRAAVLISGKPDNFIAGADINMLVRLDRTCFALWRLPVVVRLVRFSRFVLVGMRSPRASLRKS